MKTDTIVFRVDPQIKKGLEALAKKEGRSLSNFIQFNLEKLLCKERLNQKSDCEHPYASLIGEESGDPTCLSCGKKLNR